MRFSQALVFLAIVAAALPAAAGPGDGPREISGSYAAIDGNISTPAFDPITFNAGDTIDVCFYVWNGSTSTEWLTEIQVTFPTGYSINGLSDSAGPADGGGHAWLTSGVGTNIGRWSQGGACGEWGEQYGATDHYYCVNIDTPAAADGAQAITYMIEGDGGFDAGPHHVCSPGDTCIPFCSTANPEMVAADLQITAIAQQPEEQMIPVLSAAGILALIASLAAAAVVAIRRRA